MNTTASPQNQLNTKSSGTCSTASREEVSRVAYFKYEKNGKKNGNDVQNWLEAEACMLIISHPKVDIATPIRPPAVQENKKFARFE